MYDCQDLQKKVDIDCFAPLAAARYLARTPLGVELEAAGEKIRLEFVRVDVLRLKISRDGIFDQHPTFAVTVDCFSSVPFKEKRAGEVLVLETEKMKAEVNLARFSLEVFRADGSVVIGSAGGWAYAVSGPQWAVRRLKGSEDGFFGFGEKTGLLNQNGRYLQMWNFNIWNIDQHGHGGNVDNFDTGWDPYYISVPFFLHLQSDKRSAAGASFIDNGYRLHYDLTRPDSYTVVGHGGQLTEYIFAGPSMKDILGRYTELTGRMAAPPLWALGYHQGRWYDYSEKDYLELAEKFRNRRLPCDGLWIDINHMDQFKIMTWDREKFPQPTELLAQLREKGFRAVANIDPGVRLHPGYSIYEQGVEGNLFCRTREGVLFVGKVWNGDTVFPDFVKEETRRWWAGLIADYVSAGLDGAWLDMNEPSITGANESWMRFERDGADHEHARYHNQYALLMAQSTLEGLKKARPGVRSFIISRSGFAGIQRYAAVWTGDNASRWEHLAMSVTMSCNLGLSGVPFVGSDIGGFVEECSEELLVRWYQYAVFQPFFRNHFEKRASEQFPWSFSEKAESIIRSALELRYSLLPYIYTQFMRSAESGEPIQRPLVYEFQDDFNCRGIKDQCTFGEQILAAPVIEQGAGERSLYLPDCGWYLYGSSEFFSGGEHIKVPAPLDFCPVFVRAGSVVPTVQPVEKTADYAPEEIILNVYLPRMDGECTSWLHEDDGESLQYRNGHYYRTRFRLVRQGGRVTLHGETGGKGFDGFKRARFRIRVFGAKELERIIENSGEDFTLQLVE